MSRPARVLPLVVALGALVLGACSPDPEGGAGDAPIREVQKEAWTILNNVDGYPNVAHRCYGPNGIYTTRAASDAADTLVVIPNDATCTDTVR